MTPGNGPRPCGKAKRPPIVLAPLGIGTFSIAINLLYLSHCIYSN
jgi:hypothetical protein